MNKKTNLIFSIKYQKRKRKKKEEINNNPFSY